MIDQMTNTITDAEGYHDDNFFATDGIEGCFCDSLRCRQWRQSQVPPETDSNNDANFVVIDNDGVCHNDKWQPNDNPGAMH